MEPLLDTLWQLVVVLFHLAVDLIQLLAPLALVVFWLAWALGGVNWSKAWPWLAQGAWAPLVLILVVAALVWSRIAPGSCSCLALVTLPNFWWQLGAMGLIAGLTLFCGWLQGLLAWVPPEINLEPPAQAAGSHEHH